MGEEQSIAVVLEDNDVMLGLVLGYLKTRSAVEATLKRAAQIIQELEAELKRLFPNVCHIINKVKGISTAMEA